MICLAASSTRPSLQKAASRGGDLAQAELLDRPLAELELLHLAGDGHRELVEEAHVARDLDVRDPAATGLAQLVLGDRRSRTDPHPRDQLLAEALVGHAADLDVLHVRMFDQ